jgi:hypothetical protein
MEQLDEELWDIFYNAAPTHGMLTTSEVNDFTMSVAEAPDCFNVLEQFDYQEFQICTECMDLTFEFALCKCGCRMCPECIQNQMSFLASPWGVTYECPKCHVFISINK